MGGSVAAPHVRPGKCLFAVSHRVGYWEWLSNTTYSNRTQAHQDQIQPDLCSELNSWESDSICPSLRNPAPTWTQVPAYCI